MPRAIPDLQTAFILDEPTPDVVVSKPARKASRPRVVAQDAPSPEPPMVAQPAPQSPVSTTKARRSTTKAKATPPADAEVVQAKPASARKKAEASGTALQPTPVAVEPPIRKRRASTSVVDTAPVAKAPEASAAPADDRSST